LSQTVSSSAGRGELRKLTEVTENCGKDTLHEFWVIQGHRLCDVNDDDDADDDDDVLMVV